VGWVCALSVELAAARVMLDESHEGLEQDDHDNNYYSLGRIGKHNVVIACLPGGLIGSSVAAVVATQMMSTFRSIRFGLLVGIGGGVPIVEEDIRLGDVVVSYPHKSYGGVIQFDLGKWTPRGFQRAGVLNSPPAILTSAAAIVHANELRGRSNLAEHISKLRHIPKFTREAAGPDVLFDASYNHEDGPTCQSCRAEKQIARQPRLSEEPVVHYGTIASGNQIIKNAAERDAISEEFGGVLCFEVEAAGLMNSFPCLVIRGICDYADSHKNEKWQSYAAATAAAYAKELLLVTPQREVAERSTEDKRTLAQKEADKWFTGESHMGEANKFLEKYRKSPLHHKDMVTIGILDTGIDLGHPVFKPFIETRQIHQSLCRNFVKENDPMSDNSGHGTHCAHTILKVCRTARLYVAKVFENDEGDERSEDRIVEVCLEFTLLNVF
jgi:nucleoside phosphorylase